MLLQPDLSTSAEKPGLERATCLRGLPVSGWQVEFAWAWKRILILTWRCSMARWE